jgi:hypothetical protein
LTISCTWSVIECVKVIAEKWLHHFWIKIAFSSS